VPTTRLERVSSAYEAVALPVELGRLGGARDRKGMASPSRFAPPHFWKISDVKEPGAANPRTGQAEPSGRAYRPTPETQTSARGMRTFGMKMLFVRRAITVPSACLAEGLALPPV
jgi:hypothetical protein